MSHFYASIKGSRGEATRCGTKASGIRGHVRGWKIGAEVSCHVDGLGEDICHVYVTQGSLGGSWDRHIFSASREEDGSIRVTLNLRDGTFKTLRLED
jgi:hypothetical protein